MPPVLAAADELNTWRVRKVCSCSCTAVEVFTRGSDAVDVFAAASAIVGKTGKVSDVCSGETEGEHSRGLFASALDARLESSLGAKHSEAPKDVKGL